MTGENIASLKLYLPNTDLLLRRFLSLHPNLTPQAVQTLKAAVRQHEIDFVQFILDKAAARYYADLTDAQINGLIVFFQSPLGETFLRERRAITKESAVIAIHEAPFLTGEVRADMMAALKARSSASPAVP